MTDPIPSSSPVPTPTPTPGDPPATRRGFVASLRNLPNETLDREQGKGALFGIGLAVVCALTLGQSFLRYGDNATLAIIGLCAGLFGLLFNSVYLFPGRGRIAFALSSLVFLAFGGLTLLFAAPPMLAASSANDERCRAIQEDMLSAHPRKPDGPELFQALGCAPTGFDRRVFAPPTDRELKAGKSLPFGGYSPRHS